MSDELLRALAAGEQALDSGELDAAATHFAQALELAPRDVSLALALANVHRLQGDAVTQRAVLLDAYHAADWSAAGLAHTLGGALLEVGAANEAEDCFAHVLTALPRDPAALAALAAARRARGDATAAWPLIRQALELSPRQPAHMLTAAQIRHDLGDFMGALKWLDQAEQRRPGHGPTRVQRAYTMLMRAPSADAWANFEHRPLPKPATGAREWLGEPLNGRSLLVTAEQGVGDQFQFLRFVQRLPSAGADRVVVECHPHLVELLRGNGLEAVARGEPPETELHAPLLSLPHRLGVGSEVDGAAVPYLRSIAEPAPALPSVDGRRRLGLVWAGNPAFSGRMLRDFDAKLLPALVGIPGVQWISLQQGDAGEGELPGLARLLRLTSWAATASLLSQLDGLVTTDTGIAHLAGAMGVPTWVMLQKVPDWRWGMSGSTTPWYPSLKLIRQVRPGDWAGVVTRLQQDLNLY